MTMSLLWYYRPEHTEMGKKFPTSEDEILASKHRDINSVACIEDKCYVLTYSEYCRYCIHLYSHNIEIFLTIQILLAVIKGTFLKFTLGVH